MRSQILGTGHYLPAPVRTNDDIAKMVDTSDEWIRERTGIRERRIAPPEVQNSDMATAAAKSALEAAGVAPSEVDLIIVATVTGDHPMPATAVLVQQKLGAPNCPAFDISAACAGFVYALTIADSFIATKRARRVVIVGVELLSRIINWQDRGTCILFGDGAGAVVVGPQEDASESASAVLGTSIHTDGSLAPSLIIPAGGTAKPVTPEILALAENKVFMRGQDIFKVAVKNLTSTCKEALANGGLDVEQVDWLCSHQANLRILDQVAARLGIAPEKVLTNIERVGNTSSASIPILLDENVRAGKIKKGHTVLMCGLGAGISWGSALIRL
jgi:3-oxoacyl-[acyl-carrier-protein] synthase-3